MKKVFKLDEIDCAVCAEKLERAVQKLQGVDQASVNIISGKMTIEVQPECMEDVVMQVKSTIRRLEPDISVILIQ